MTPGERRRNILKAIGFQRRRPRPSTVLPNWDRCLYCIHFEERRKVQRYRRQCALTHEILDGWGICNLFRQEVFIGVPEGTLTEEKGVITMKFHQED